MGDPFQVIDVDGVGQLVQMSVERGRSTRPDLKVGICGEHGGEPISVEFFAKSGLDYVSCSPFRVPIALSPRRKPRFEPRKCKPSDVAPSRASFIAATIIPLYDSREFKTT